jgi:hypothetical protein
MGMDWYFFMAGFPLGLSCGPAGPAVDNSFEDGDTHKVGKTRYLLILCPVLSCGGGPREASRTAVAQEPAVVTPGPGVAVAARPVETVPRPVLLAGPGQMVLDSLYPRGPVIPGDTLARLADPVSPFLESRTLMALALAESRGDLPRADSLRAVLESPPWFAWVLSPLAGEPAFPPRGTLLTGGDTLAMISAPAESLWVLYPQTPLTFWPPVPGAVFLESSRESALVAGSVPEEGFVLPGTWTLPGTALWEEGLRIFVIAAPDDSIPVRVMGETPSGILVHCETSLDSLPLLPWAVEGSD